MNKQKIVELAGKLMLASATNSPEIDEISTQLIAELRQTNENGNKDATLLPLDNTSTEIWYRLLKFTDKEILTMPKTFRKEFRTEGCTAHVRKRKSGKKTFNYEIRYRRNGYNISVSHNNLEKAKQKFIEKLHYIEKYGEEQKVTLPDTFNEFATYFFETFWKRKVADETYKVGMYRYKNHILTHFGSIKLKRITPLDCQKLLDKLTEKGFCKTADEVYSTLNLIFKAAIKHSIMTLNPLDMVYHERHKRKHGKALSKDEERKLLTASSGTPFQLMYATALYTGLRPNEYKTAYIDGKFIVAINSKQKNGKVEYKKIPICSFLYAILNGCTELPKRHDTSIRNKYKEILPKHTLKDLRKTFNTRCIKCKVDTFARKKYMGHSVGKLDKTYVGNIDDYLLTEGKKLEKWYSYPKCTPNSDE